MSVDLATYNSQLICLCLEDAQLNEILLTHIAGQRDVATVPALSGQQPYTYMYQLCSFMAFHSIFFFKRNVVQLMCSTV